MNYVSVNNRNWVFRKFDNNYALSLSEKFSLKEITSKLLAIRNIKNIDHFLNPTIKNSMPNPTLLKDMDVAIERTIKNITGKKTIGIFGDYDVDGATSTALLTKYFLEIKQKINFYIPDRKKDGYGPNIRGFNELIDKGSSVIFTVDCGTSSFDPISFSQEKGVDVIVLDHHQADTKLPEACAIVNPNRVDDSSGLNYLSAAGVCFMFLAALNIKLRDIKWFEKSKINEPNILNYLDLVCLGTVCDVSPLIGLNRAIVSQGLKILKKRNNLGLKTLYDICDIQTHPNVYHLGYILGPRINAGGRVGKSSHGAELLISKDLKKIFQIASDLNAYNKERQDIERKLLYEVDLKANKISSDPLLILSDNNWHEGVMGIVASRIKEKYNKPTIIISFNGNEGKGSARSIFGFDIGSSIIAAVQSKILLKGGGHKMAGGFSLEKKNLEQFKNFLFDKFKKSNLDQIKNKNLYLDSIIAPTALNEDFYNDINLLSPFGSGNPEPRFVIENLKIVKTTILKQKHIKTVMYATNGQVIKGIAYNCIDTPMQNYLISKNKVLNIAGKISLNEWLGKRDFEFIIEDVSVEKIN